MTVRTKRITLFLAMFLLCAGLTACGLKGVRENSSEEEVSAEVTSALPVEAETAGEKIEPLQLEGNYDLKAVDGFLTGCLAELENGSYRAELNVFRFPTCGRNPMFVVMDKTGETTGFICNVPETIAYVPPELGEELLCWDPGECDTVFVVSSEPESWGEYDDGTSAYATNTMVSVLFPKTGTFWGPECVHTEPPPDSIVRGTEKDGIHAPFRWNEGIEYILSSRELMLPVCIRLLEQDFSFYADLYVLSDPDKLAEFGPDAYSSMSATDKCLKLLEIPKEKVLEYSEEAQQMAVDMNFDVLWRRTRWQDLDGLVLKGENGSELMILANEEQQNVRITRTESQEQFELLAGSGTEPVLSTDEIAFGREYTCLRSD